MSGRRGGVLLLGLALAIPQSAMAQYLDTSTVLVPRRPERPSTARSAFRRDREQAVAERMFDAFTATGLDLGGVEAFPALAVQPEFISNPLANEDRRGSVAAVIVRPELTVRTRGGPVDVDVYGRGAITRVSRYTTENTEQLTGGMQADAEVGGLTSLFGGASYASLVLPRYASDSPVDARKPLEYRALRANLGARSERGRFRLTLRGDLERLRFSDGQRNVGVILFARDRDRTVLNGSARLEYAVRPNASVYVAATGNRIDYRLAPPVVPLRRDSTGWGGFVGTSVDVTAFLRADARIGYIRQRFAAGFRPISGLGLNGRIEYFPTRLTTVTLSGEREVRDSGVPGTGGIIHTGGELRVDHELRRYIVGTLLAGYARDVFRGAIRRERNAFAGASGTYLSGRGWSARVGYQYNQRSCVCSNVGASFRDHRAFTALTLQY